MTLTVNTAGFPWVEVWIDPASLVAGTVSLRVWRYSDDRSWLVRGGVDIAPGVAVLDAECPFGVQSVYRAEQFDAAGVSLGFTVSESVHLDVPHVWVHDVLDPFNGVDLGADAVLGAIGVNSRPVPGDVVSVVGSATPRWVGSRRLARAPFQLGLAVPTVDLMDQIQAMIGGYEDDRLGVLCIRTPPPARLPRTLFAAVADDNEISRDVSWGGQRSDFLFTAVEVEPPFPGLSMPLLTYDDLDVSYASYDVRDAAYGSYTDMDRDYSLAGAANA